jgi:hypothetical protein
LFTIESIDWAINELHIKGEIMKTPLRLSLVAGLFCASLGASNFDVGISGSERGIDGFNLSIGDYYRVPYQEVVMIERSSPRDEMSVVYTRMHVLLAIFACVESVGGISLFV